MKSSSSPLLPPLSSCLEVIDWISVEKEYIRLLHLSANTNSNNDENDDDDDEKKVKYFSSRDNNNKRKNIDYDTLPSVPLTEYCTWPEAGMEPCDDDDNPTVGDGGLSSSLFDINVVNSCDGGNGEQPKTTNNNNNIQFKRNKKKNIIRGTRNGITMLGKFATFLIYLAYFFLVFVLFCMFDIITIKNCLDDDMYILFFFFSWSNFSFNIRYLFLNLVFPSLFPLHYSHKLR